MIREFYLHDSASVMHKIYLYWFSSLSQGWYSGLHPRC